MSYYSDLKKQRMENIIDYVKNENPEKEKAIAEIEIEFGLSSEKAEEYLNKLVDAGKIKETDQNKLVVSQ